MDHFLNLYWICYKIVYVFVFLATRHMGSQLPDQGLNPHSLHWKKKAISECLLCAWGRPKRQEKFSSFCSCILIELWNPKRGQESQDRKWKGSENKRENSQQLHPRWQAREELILPTTEYYLAIKKEQLLTAGKILEIFCCPERSFPESRIHTVEFHFFKEVLEQADP